MAVKKSPVNLMRLALLLLSLPEQPESSAQKEKVLCGTRFLSDYL
ncbi:hypothetical protein NC99_09160 [Sunxiuqinia dokdonensis]|uniref:Uncharacterized protein n=1 Tax=Sunxiuqinia dokdonensis TaxID=1409788 RepID=A0A0L8VCS2_9BACT|nr:hypothetical protein NC99_09160 [Sunxiuqinia dokdonensis]